MCVDKTVTRLEGQLRKLLKEWIAFAALDLIEYCDVCCC